MTREEREKAIVIIENEKPHCGRRITFTKEEKCEAYDMAIAALKAEPCEDCVSRQAVLDALYASGRPTELFDYITEVHSDIASLPSVTPKQKTGKWIIKIDCEGKTRRCICDQCNYETGLYTWKNPNFCEECGAKMEGESE